MESEAPLFSTLHDSGKGRAFVLLVDDDLYHTLALDAARALESKFSGRIVLIRSERVSDDDWRAISRQLPKYLGAIGIRQGSFLAFGGACALLQELALTKLSMIRSLHFVDPSSRPHPTRFSRIIDRLERALPLGLPLRSRLKGFDGKPFLHRMRCPTLVISSSRAGSFLRAQAGVFSEHLPTAWVAELVSEREGEELARLIAEFQLVPSKAPQKNRFTQIAPATEVVSSG